ACDQLTLPSHAFNTRTQNLVDTGVASMVWFGIGHAFAFGDVCRHTTRHTTRPTTRHDTHVRLAAHGHTSLRATGSSERATFSYTTMTTTRTSCSRFVCVV